MPKHLAVCERERIIALHQHTSQSPRQIASNLNISQSAVMLCIKTFQETGKATQKPRSGRPKVTSHKMDSRICRLVTKFPFISAAEIKNNLHPVADKVSVNTIKRRLRIKFGISSRKPSKKPFITQKMRKRRLEFCTENATWTHEH